MADSVIFGHLETRKSKRVSLRLSWMAFTEISEICSKKLYCVNTYTWQLIIKMCKIKNYVAEGVVQLTLHLGRPRIASFEHLTIP